MTTNDFSLRSLSFLFLTVTLLFVASPARAATLYVDVNSGACSDGITREQNSQAQPFCSIQRGSNVAQPGDLVLVADGDYPDVDGNGIALTVRGSGTSSAPVVLRAMNLHQARIIGSLPADPNAFTYAVTIATGVHDVVIEGFEMTGAAKGININNDNSYITVRRNHIHNIGRRVTETSSGQDGVFVGYTCSHVEIDGNVIHTIGRLPGSLYPHNHDHGVYIRGNYVDITNNVFYDHTAGWAIHIYGSGWKEHIRIVNNTFADPNLNRDGHVLITSQTRHVLIQNNIFHQPRTAPVRNTSCTDVSDITIIRNLTDRATIVIDSPCDFLISDNFTGVDPLFVAPAQRDFRLQSGSPAIDRGSAAGAPAVDHDGNPRPGGAGFDIGAFEHDETPADGSPELVAAATADPNPVDDTTTSLSVLAGHDDGESTLIYTWSASGPAGVSFSPNGTNAAKGSTASFTQADSYTITATAADSGGRSVQSSVEVEVLSTVTAIDVSPSSATVAAGHTRQFSAEAEDQFGDFVSPSGGIDWSVSGGGTIDSSGLFTAGESEGGPFVVTAGAEGATGNALVTVGAGGQEEPALEVLLVEPSNGDVIFGSLYVLAEATGDAEVVAITFEVNEEPAQTLYEEPWEIWLDVTHWKPGELVIVAVAEDARGETARSEPVTVTRREDLSIDAGCECSSFQPHGAPFPAVTFLLLLLLLVRSQRPPMFQTRLPVRGS